MSLFKPFFFRFSLAMDDSRLMRLFLSVNDNLTDLCELFVLLKLIKSNNLWNLLIEIARTEKEREIAWLQNLLL